MVIAIDLTSLSYHITGIERYALCVTKEMLKIDRGNEYVLIFRNEVFPDFQNDVDGVRIKSIILTGDNKLLFYQFVLMKALYRIKADKYLFFAFSSPMLFWHKGIINTIHDMGAWDAAEALTIKQKLYFRVTGRIAAIVSQKIITVSEFSKTRIWDILRYPRERIHVVPSAIVSGFMDSTSVPYDTIEEKYKLPKKYIMSLSTLEPRKNLELLLRAFTEIADQVEYDLVLVGRKGWKIDSLIEACSVQNRVHLTGFVEDKDVKEIYRHAMCFVFPSKYEGFGLPPLEALALGTPVVSSNAASMPEVLMDRAVYFENNNKNALKGILLRLDELVEQMPRGLNNYQKEEFRFGVSAEKIAKLISKA